MSLCKGEGPSYPILKTFRDFLVKKIDFLLIVFSFPTPQVPSPPTKVSQNLIYFSGDPTREEAEIWTFENILVLRFCLDLTHQNGCNSLNF